MKKKCLPNNAKKVIKTKSNKQTVKTKRINIIEEEEQKWEIKNETEMLFFLLFLSGHKHTQDERKREHRLLCINLVFIFLFF